MPNVTVPKEFFVKERRMYANWQFAFWRELFQNSVDAGASVIRIALSDKGGGVIGIDFEDNGSGMTRETLETVYFRLGASTKNDGSTVGGFGRARILTCFSMKNYAIHTQDNLVQGDGGSYEIASADFRRGCLVQLEVENERFSTLKEALDEYLSYSQLPCSVFVNEERWTKWSYRRQLTRSLDVGDATFAYVYVNKSAANNRLLVRVNGTVMYHQYIRAKAQVIVEVEPAVAREVLTANRDGMHVKYDAILRSFADELASDTSHALSDRLKKKNATIRGRGLILTAKPKPAPTAEELAELEAARSSSVQPAQPVEAKEGQGSVRLAQPGEAPVLNVRIAQISGVDSAGTNRPKREPRLGERFLTDLPDVFITDDTENPAIRKVIDLYNPDSWVVCETQGKRYNKGGKFYRLLMLWQIACQAAVDSLLRYHASIDQIVWGIGWNFSDSAEAFCKSVPGGHAFLLNPVDKNGKIRYSLRNSKDLKRLMALAKHEVAHTQMSYHDESFAGILTDIDCEFDEKETFRKMKDFLAERN